MEEMYHSVSQQLDDERKRRSAAVQTLTIAENSNTDLKHKLKAEEQAKKSAKAALKGAETQAESQRKLTNEAKEQLAASKEQVAALKQQLEGAKKLKEQAEKAKMQAEEDKAKVEKERDEAEQHGYDVSVAEIEDALRAEVPAVCRAYCAQTWEEALNQVGIKASSELRKPENIIFPPALQIPSQKEVPPPTPQPVKEAQSQHPLSTSQQKQGREQEIQKGPSSDKVTVAPQPGAASQDFEKQLASVTLPTQGSLKGKEKETLPKVADQAPKSKLQIKLNLNFCTCFYDIYNDCNFVFCIEGQILIRYETFFLGPNNICQYYCSTQMYGIHFILFPILSSTYVIKE